MKKLILALVLLLAPSAAWAQCNGQFSNGQVCGVATGGPKLPGPVAASGFANATLPTPTRAGDVMYWNGSAWVTLAGNNSGAQAFTENASGVPAWASIIAVTATRAGDVIYWNGSAWVSLAGNNSGTQFLQENASGVPVWGGITGTPSANQVAQWASATSLQGVNVASLLTAGTGISITGTTTATIAISQTTATNSLGSDLAISNSVYTDGPSMAQGTSGTWWASGTVTIQDTAGAAQYQLKLHDGTTVIASARGSVSASNIPQAFSLSGFIASPAGNIRISAQSSTATSTFKFNSSGNSKDSTISGHRIQ